MRPAAATRPRWRDRSRAVVAGLAAMVALTWPTGPAAGAIAAAGDERSSLPDIAAVVAAQQRVRQWVDAMSMPGPEEPSASLPIDGATACCVLIRRGGRVIGVGMDGPLPDGADRAMLVRRAAGRALGEARGDDVIRSVPEALREGIGQGLTVELEIAGPLRAVPGRTMEQVLEMIEPGVDGVAMRRGARTVIRFPAHVRATNLPAAMDRVLMGMALDLGVGEREARTVLVAADVGVYTTRTIHVAQASAQAPLQVTSHGEVVVEDDAVTSAAVMALADGLADHLLASRWPGQEPLGLMGNYQPVSDRYEPKLASPLEQALGALALAMYGSAPGIEAGRATIAISAAVSLLDALAIVTDEEEDPRSSVDACAAIVLAVDVTAPMARTAAMLALEAEARQRLKHAASLLSAAPAGPGAGRERQPMPSPHSLALQACGLARAARRAGQSSRWVDLALVRAVIDAAWAAAADHQQVTLLPWIGWAEQDCAALEHLSRDNMGALRADAQTIGHEAELARLRDALHAGLIGASTAGQEPVMRGSDWRQWPELRGAFALVAAGVTGAPGAPRAGLPGRAAIGTAQSARPAAWLARALGDPRLTPSSRVAIDLARLLRSIRFLRQLAIRPENAWTVRNLTRGLGGIRAGLTDSSQPVAAQAMALMAAAETLASLHVLAGQEPLPGNQSRLMPEQTP